MSEEMRLFCEIWLSLTLNFNPLAMNRAIKRFGSAKGAYDVFVSCKKDFNELGLGKDLSVAQTALSRAELVFNTCQAKNITALAYDDDDFPKRLRQVPDSPRVLYIRGNIPNFDCRVCVTVVGTRHPTAYGVDVASKLAFDLATWGVSIISGLAAGVDASAHTGAILSGYDTVAVLGCGIDIVYPASNLRLHAKILECGTVMSEYPPGTRAHRMFFPRRNRIMAALAMGIVVVEGAYRSGTRHTVSRAAEYGRDIFAVPGNINSENSYMPNELIKDGAIPVTNVQDVLNVYRDIYPGFITEPRKVGYEGTDVVRENSNRVGIASRLVQRDDVVPKRDSAAEIREKCKNLNRVEQLIVEYLYKGGRSHADVISRSCGLSASAFNSTALILQMKGIIKESVGKNYECTQ